MAPRDFEESIRLRKVSEVSADLIRRELHYTESKQNCATEALAHNVDRIRLKTYMNHGRGHLHLQYPVAFSSPWRLQQPLRPYLSPANLPILVSQAFKPPSYQRPLQVDPFHTKSHELRRVAGSRSAL